jgi:hypothetical protein
LGPMIPVQQISDTLNDEGGPSLVHRYCPMP